MEPLYAISDDHMVINPTLTLVIPFMSVTNSMMTYLPTGSRTAAQHYTVDHLARGSMKNGANSVMPCELQNT